ncbi:MAG: hypothetical protein BGO95_04190 [Micrococcales bacterium 73-13]|nr:MAG: hypothetical protein BGO95_04190 [Micrococcales bacterium 73-13]
MREGVFVVRGNGFSFLASAYSGRRFRFDPVTMSPGDQMARQAVAWFQEQRDMAVIHQWDQEEQLLFIDNRQALHAREAVVTDSETRVLGRLSLNFVEET